MKRILLIFLVIAVLLLSGCDMIPFLQPEPTPAPTPALTPTPMPTPALTPTLTPVELKPVLVNEWTGTGNMTTKYFSTTGELWLVSWANNPELVEGKSNGYLQIIVYNIEDPGSPVNIAADATKAGGSVSYITEQGTFYLEINAVNTQWTARVWDYIEE